MPHGSIQFYSGHAPDERGEIWPAIYWEFLSNFKKLVNKKYKVQSCVKVYEALR